MALHWNIQKIKDFAEVVSCEVSETGPPVSPWTITDSLFWACMATEMSGITEKNYQEFYIRISMWEDTVGPFIMTQKDGHYFITPDDIERRIGLTTNVSQRTSKFFDNKIGQVARRVAENSWHLDRRKKEGILEKLKEEHEAMFEEEVSK